MSRLQQLPRGLAVLTLAVLTLSGGTLAGLTPAGSAAVRPATTATLASVQHPGAAAVQPGTAVSAPSWRVRDLARESTRLRSSSQVISVARRDGFALLPNLTDTQFQLERFAVTGGHVLHGPKFAVRRLPLADGFLWVYGEIPAGRDSHFAK
jgi:hypothetical protein